LKTWRRAAAQTLEDGMEDKAPDRRLVRQVAHVCIFARDLEETRQFYERNFGMLVKFNFTRNDAWYGFYLDAGGNTNVEVFHKPGAAFSEANQINHICLEVFDIDEAIAHVRACGTTITDKKLGCDETYQAWVTDPNGVKIELFQYTAKSAQFVGGDRVADW
jgi:glyoxylase I family protein